MKEYKVTEFTGHLFSKEPVPGGGGAAALAGALGAGLGGMVTNYTIGKKKYKEKEPEMIEARSRLQELMEELQDLMQKDAEGFEPLSRAYGLPKETPEEIAYKEKVMEEALVNACKAPLAMMEAAYEAAGILEFLGEHGSVMVISDVAVGAAMVRAALQGAALNIAINTKSMKNRDVAACYEEKMDRMLQDGVLKMDALYEKIWQNMRK